MEKLLKLIEEGDAGKILSEENLYSKFNELLKYDLVEIKDAKVFLTQKGELAKLEGVEQAIRREKRKLYLDSHKIEEKKKNRFLSFFDDHKRKKFLVNLLLLFLAFIPFWIKFISSLKKKFRK